MGIQELLEVPENIKHLDDSLVWDSCPNQFCGHVDDVLQTMAKVTLKTGWKELQDVETNRCQLWVGGVIDHVLQYLFRVLA